MRRDETGRAADGSIGWNGARLPAKLLTKKTAPRTCQYSCGAGESLGCQVSQSIVTPPTHFLTISDQRAPKQQPKKSATLSSPARATDLWRCRLFCQPLACQEASHSTWCHWRQHC